MSKSGCEVNIRRLERSLRLLNVKEIDEDLIEYLKDICESTQLTITNLNDNDEEARDEFYEVIETTLSELGLSDVENIVDRLIDIYRRLNDDDQDDNAEDDDYIGLNECQLCERVMPLTIHHLIPRSEHKRVIGRNAFSYDECITRLSRICRQCHSAIHKHISNKDLADIYNTIESLLTNQSVLSFVKYASKLRHHNPNFRLKDKK